jgi:ATP adenylyltransferase
MSDCIFCNKEKLDNIYSDDIFYVIRDGYPVTKGHTLIILNDHNKSYFDLRDVDIIRLNQIIRFQKDELIEKDNSISGFNIGINQGKDAGQTVMHLHIHLIPRRKGDVEDPKGGVRGVIPVKQNYSKD